MPAYKNHMPEGSVAGEHVYSAPKLSLCNFFPGPHSHFYDFHSPFSVKAVTAILKRATAPEDWALRKKQIKNQKNKKALKSPHLLSKSLKL